LAIFPTCADEIDPALESALSSIAAKHYENLFLSIGSFTYADSGIAGPFSRYLADRITVAVAKLSSSVSLYMHDATDDMPAEFKEVFGTFISAKGVRQIVRGRYGEEGNVVKVSIEVIDFSTGTLVGREDISVPRSAIPRSAALVPQNFDLAVNAMRDLGDILAGRQGSFAIAATTTRGNGAVYQEDESFVLNIASSKDCYVKVYHVNAEGVMKLIFPEKGYSNFVKARTLFTVPDAEYPVDFVVAPPFGAESLKIVAATEPFAVIEPAFIPLGRAKKEFVSMDLKPREKDSKALAEAAEVYIVYTTIPK